MLTTDHDGAGPPGGGRPTTDSTTAAKPQGPHAGGRAAVEPAIELKGLRKTYKMGRGKP
ncbi:MAG: hypothetical protein IID55_12075, partial [Proteobacteria bacterium]|nr:hypothetical protein [Pseudomonadota bacterium]